MLLNAIISSFFHCSLIASTTSIEATCAKYRLVVFKELCHNACCKTADVCLDRAKLQDFYLRNINFFHGKIFNEREGKYINYSGQVYLREADLKYVNAEKAWFANAHLEKTCWWYANAGKADFHGTHLEKAQLGVSKLNECQFNDAILTNAALVASAIFNHRYQRISTGEYSLEYLVC